MKKKKQEDDRRTGKKELQIAEIPKIEINQVTGQKKSTWKEEVKEKVISKVKKGIIEKMARRTKCRTLEKWQVGKKGIHKRKQQQSN